MSIGNSHDSGGEFRKSIKGKKTQEYTAWQNMLKRCYAGYSHNTAWKDCEVCAEWLDFQEFAKWYTAQEGYAEGWQVDKDLIVEGNRVYSESTCSLVPAEINSLFLKGRKSTLGLPEGVGKNGKKYRSEIHVGGYRYLGTFSTIIEAAQAYQEAKAKYIVSLLVKYEDRLHPAVTETLRSRTTNINLTQRY